MPAIRQEDKIKTDLYKDISTVAEDKLKDDANYCAVIAIAVAAEVDVAVAHAACEKHGRVKREGTPFITMVAALAEFDLKMVQVNPREYIKDYRGVHSEVLKNVTTHHPKRFSEVWQDGQTYFFFSAGHVAAIVDGVNHDWTKGSAKRAKQIYAIRPKASKNSKYLKTRGAA